MSSSYAPSTRIQEAIFIAANVLFIRAKKYSEGDTIHGNWGLVKQTCLDKFGVMQSKLILQAEHAIQWLSLASPRETFEMVSEAVARFEQLSMSQAEGCWQIAADGIIYRPLSPVSGVLLRDNSNLAITASFLRCYRLRNEVMVLSLEDGRRILCGDVLPERLAMRHQCTVGEAQKALLVAGILDGHRAQINLSTENWGQLCG